MVTTNKRHFLLPALTAGLVLGLADRLPAQTFKVLYSFTSSGGPAYTNSDGAGPFGGLVLSGNTLYGTAGRGGSSDAGTVFKVNTDGTGFTNLHIFSDGSEGAEPQETAGLVLSSNTLYGTAFLPLDR